MHGMANRLCVRLAEQLQDAKQGQLETPNGDNTLPALASLYQVHDVANQNALEAEGITLTTRKITDRVNSAAGYYAGADAANGVDLGGQGRKRING